MNQIAEVKLATSIAEIQQCLPVILQLRPHLQANSFVRQVQQQRSTGYRLAYLQATDVVGVAGFNLAQNLACGKYLYVADLIVDANMRSQGYGKILFD